MELLDRMQATRATQHLVKYVKRTVIATSKSSVDLIGVPDFADAHAFIARPCAQ